MITKSNNTHSYWHCLFFMLRRLYTQVFSKNISTLKEQYKLQIIDFNIFIIHNKMHTSKTQKLKS